MNEYFTGFILLTIKIYSSIITLKTSFKIHPFIKANKKNE